MKNEIAPYWQNYVNGKWVDGGADRLGIEDPGTGTAVAEIALADTTHMDRARCCRLKLACQRRADSDAPGGTRPHGCGDGALSIAAY